MVIAEIQNVGDDDDDKDICWKVVRKFMLDSKVKTTSKYHTWKDLAIEIGMNNVNTLQVRRCVVKMLRLLMRFSR